MEVLDWLQPCREKESEGAVRDDDPLHKGAWVLTICQMCAFRERILAM